MALPPARVIYSTLFFVLTMLLIIVARPKGLFEPSGRAKEFGTGGGGDQQGRTVFPIGVVVVLVAVLSLYTFAMIDLVFN